MDCCTVPATHAGLQTLISFTENQLDLFSIRGETRQSILIILEELAVNIVNYAYGDTPGEIEMTLGLSEDKTTLRLTLSDSGTPFNPLAKSDPDLSLSSEERPIGGLGIFMAKSLADTFEYDYRNQQNWILIEKRLK
ncbi:MAG: ATP-binding protein [Eubacterium sp.]